MAERLANAGIAARRLGQAWTLGAPGAARQLSRLWPLWAGGSLLVALCVVGLDAASVVWVRDLPVFVVDFFQWLTHYGKSDWLLFPSGTLCLVLLFSDWRTVSRRIAAAWTEIGLLVGFAFLSIAGSGIVTNVIKQIVGRGRPVVFDRDGVFSLVPFQFDYAQASFPSGHATTMGATAVVIAIVAPRVRWAAFAICGFVALSRVFVAAHYPSDVVAGFMLGGAFSWFYALALCGTGTVFSREADGTIRARVIAVRHVFCQPGGISIAMGSVWPAVFGCGAQKRAV